MASIGDLYFTFRGDGARLKADAKKDGAVAGDVAGKGFVSQWKASLSSMKGGLLAGLGLGAGLGAVGIATAGIQKLTDVMGDATQAAIEEEQSVAKLDAALRANIEAYDGNTDAIEETLAARMKLGFADDEQRESLALMVAAYKDVDKALAAQRTAMDLARLKGISLKEASEALVKVEGGQFRMLKSLGIQLPKNATATEALAAVQRVAAGQAEAYANTSGGKLLASQIEVGEQMEKLGAVILPAVVEGTQAAVGVITSLAEALEKVAEGGENNADPLQNLGNLMSDLNQRGEESKTWLGSIDEGLSNMADGLLEVADNTIDSATFWDEYERVVDEKARKIAQSTEDMANVMSHRSGEIADDVGVSETAFSDLGDEAEETADDVEFSTGRIVTSSEDLKNFLIADLNELIAGYYDPIQQRQDIQANNAELTAQRAILADENATTEQKRNARERITDLERNTLELRVKLLEAGKLSAKEQAALLADLQKKLQASKGPARAAIQAIIDKVRELTNLTGTGIKVSVNYGPRQGSQARASGGPVMAGSPYWVGEEGPELIVPQSSGFVLPANVSAGVAAGAAGDTTINVNLLDRMPAESVRDIGSGLRMLEFGGYLGPKTHHDLTIERR